MVATSLTIFTTDQLRKCFNPIIPMSKPEPRINVFYAFCSLFLPGLGQLLQKRTREAAGFFALFVLSGFLPVLIVSLLFMDRFSYQPMRVHILHIFAFGGLYLVFLLVIFWSVIDAAGNSARMKEDAPDETSPVKQKRPSHFTLVELLVVIAIVGVLIALLLPSVPAARESARRMQCSNNMKQIAIGFHNYHDKYGCFPPAYTVDEDGNPLHGWRVLILPFIEYTALYEKIRLDEPWDSEYNVQFHSEAPSIFRCPSGSPRETVPVPAPAGCFYSVVIGPKAAFFGSQSRSTDELDKLGETIFMVERRTPVNWMDPSREITFETAAKGGNADAMGISSYHPNGAHAAFGDGSIRYLSDDIDLGELRKMLTIRKKSGK